MAHQPHPEEPTAAARLTISFHKIDAGVEVPAKHAPSLMRLFASLTRLTIMAVICPAVTLNEVGHTLSPGWTAFFLIFELTAAISLSIWPCRSRRLTTGHPLPARARRQIKPRRDPGRPAIPRYPPAALPLPLPC